MTSRPLVEISARKVNRTISLKYLENALLYQSCHILCQLLLFCYNYRAFAALRSYAFHFWGLLLDVLSKKSRADAFCFNGSLNCFSAFNKALIWLINQKVRRSRYGYPEAKNPAAKPSSKKLRGGLSLSLNRRHLKCGAAFYHICPPLHYLKSEGDYKCR